MKVKKLVKKIIISIILIMIIFGSFTNCVKSAQLDFSSAYLIEIIYSYYANKENNDALPDDDPLKGYQDDALLNNITTAVNQAWGNDPSGFITEFEDTYTNTQGTETEKNKEALINALSKISQFSGTASNIVSFSENKISEDAGDTGSTGNTGNTGDTGSTGDNNSSSEIENVDADYIKQLLYNYYTSPEYANVNGGVTAAIAEQKAQDLVDKYGAQMVEAYNNAYNSSTLTNEDERREYAFQQAIAVTKGEDAILDGDYTGESTSVGDAVGNALDGLAGVVFWVIKLIPMIIANLILRIICLAINGVDGLISGIPLDKILFNEIPILSINFFQNATSGAGADIINNIRNQVSIWYVAIRNLSAAILAVMVLYVGIRMAISSVAEDKAKYKRMLADWVVSLVLLFVLHYIMILIININDGIVAILAKAATATKGESSTIMDSLWDNAMDITSPFTVQLGNTILYFMLAIMSFVFFATYIKRMITIAFLIMIAPIITITYSLDRMGDGKSQALNTWFKNFVYNILLQPFQCIIYIALVKTAIEAISAADLSSVVIAIIMVFFMYEAEDIVKEIFHFEGKSVANTIAQAALVSSAIGLVSKTASGTKTVKGYAGGKPSKSNANTTQPTTTNKNIQNNEVDQQNPDNSRNTDESKGKGTTEPKDTSQPLNRQESQGKSTNTVLDSIWGATKKVGKAGLKVGKVGMKLSSGIILGAAGLGTGNLTNGLTGFQTGTAISGNILANMEEKSNLRKFAKDYRNTSSVYADHDDNWIREHTKDLLNGDVQVKDYEKDYYNTVLNEMDRYIAQGLSADDAVTQVEQNVAGVQRNYITETGVRQRFTGKIKNKFKHGYADNQDNQNTKNKTNDQNN